MRDGDFGKSPVVRLALGAVIVGLMQSIAISPASAEDIEITSPSGSRSSNVRARQRARPAQRRAVPRPIRRRGQEQAINLDALATPSRSAAPAEATNPVAAPATSTSTRSMGGLSPHGNSGVLPNFKFYFDFLAKSWKADPNRASFDFDSYHQRMLVEFTPTPELMFQADISMWQQPEYFEVDYQITPKVQLRWGRIWIPFDDMSPHSIFGGRINTSEFFQGNETAFLPNIWADSGFGLKYQMADTPSFGSVVHAYAVNGFGSGGTSPVDGEGGTVEYPNFLTAPRFTVGGATDNNNNKALGGRVQFRLGQRFSVGGSVYNGAYTNKMAEKSKSITMLGGDAQLRPTNTTEIRVGLVSMKVGLNAPTGVTTVKESFSRAASYVELGQRFGQDDRWKFLVRAGKGQNDNRVVDVSDKTLVGMTLLRSFRAIEAQLTFYKDMNKVPSKIAYNYAHFRLVTAF